MNNKDRAKLGLSKKRFYQRVWFWLLVVVVLGFAGCTATLNGASNAINKANTTPHTIVYSVTGSGSADITYFTIDNGNTGNAEVSATPLPWSKTITGSGLFNAFTVSATLDANGGTATCTLTIDGKVVATNTASGAYASASCTGSSS